MKRISQRVGFFIALLFSPGMSAAALAANAPQAPEIPLQAVVEGIAPSSQVDSEHPDRPTLGRYFARTKYEPAPLPKFETTRAKLPSPIYDENTNWVAMRQGNGLYMTDWASMDNSPRNVYLAKGGCAVDTSSQMVLFADDLAVFADILGKKMEAAQFKREAVEIAARINQFMWDPDRRFYYDLAWEGARVPVKTIAGFWPLIAGIPTKAQAEALATELQNTNTFNRVHRVPTLAADQQGYDPRGGYWRGAVWAPTDTMVIRGLERYGYHTLARDIALNHLVSVGELFTRTGTVWENYAPDSLDPGKPAKGDFVGWSGIGPIVYLFEFAVGLTPDARSNTLTWKLISSRKSGCERYRFNGHVADLLATPDRNQWNIRVHSDGKFTLKVALGGGEKTFAVRKGDNLFTTSAPSL